MAHRAAAAPEAGHQAVALLVVEPRRVDLLAAYLLQWIFWQWIFWQWIFWQWIFWQWIFWQRVFRQRHVG